MQMPPIPAPLPPLPTLCAACRSPRATTVETIPLCETCRKISTGRPLPTILKIALGLVLLIAAVNAARAPFLVTNAIATARQDAAVPSPAPTAPSHP